MTTRPGNRFHTRIHAYPSRPALLQDFLVSLVAVPRVKRYQTAAEKPDREGQGQCLGGVVSKNGHTVTGPNAMPGQLIGHVVDRIPPLTYAPFRPRSLGLADSDQERPVIVFPAAEERRKVRPGRRVSVNIAPCNRFGRRRPAALLSHHVEPFLNAEHWSR
jgi:hypothetical protein